MRDHVLIYHKDQISDEVRNELLMNNVDVDNYKKGSELNLPSEPVVDPETGELLSKNQMKKRIRHGVEQRKTTTDAVWDYFKVNADNPTEYTCQLCWMGIVEQVQISDWSVVTLNLTCYLSLT